MGWGTGAWGSSAWGFGVVAELSMTRAYATSARGVRVVLSRSVNLAIAQDPTTWTVTRADGSTVLVEAAMVVSLGDEVELFLMSKLPAYPETLTVSAPFLRALDGRLISLPVSATFSGVFYQTPQQSAQTIDISNPPFGNETAAAGTIHVGSSGDYDEVSGADLLRKLIFRRLMSARGEFFHLPNYGIGLKLKEPMRTPDLVKLRTEIQMQTLNEPEVDSATVGIAMATSGVLTVTVRAILTKTQAAVTVSFELPTTLVNL